MTNLQKMMIEREKEGKGFNFFHFMIDLNGGPCVAKRLSGCGSGTEYLAVTPWGDLYPCHQFVGQGFSDGNGRWNREAELRTISEAVMYSKDKCRNCLQNSIAVVDVWQTLTISTVRSMIPMRSAVRCRGSV